MQVSQYLAALLMFFAVAAMISCDDPAHRAAVLAGVDVRTGDSHNGDSYLDDEKTVIHDAKKTAKLDILWVIDDSPSMCQEQQALASNFRTFLEVFQRFTSIDMRVAVTSTNVCIKDPAKPDEAVRGKFLYSPAKSFPPDCVQSRAMVCNSDADCHKANLPDAQNWVCTGSSAENLYTCDVPPEIIESTGRDDGYEGDVLRSVQSECRYRCSRDNPAQCARVFGSSDACSKTSVGANPSMCDGGTCSTNACISNPLLRSSVDCSSACRSQECTHKRV